MPLEPPARRAWHALDPLRVAVAVALLAVVLAALATLVVRERIARLPEIGRATPIEELRAAWAEADEGEARTPSPPVTMPKIRPRPRPVDIHPNMETER